MLLPLKEALQRCLAPTQKHMTQPEARKLRVFTVLSLCSLLHTWLVVQTLRSRHALPCLLQHFLDSLAKSFSNTLPFESHSSLTATTAQHSIWAFAAGAGAADSCNPGLVGCNM